MCEAHYMISRICFFFFFKQKTAYEMRISDWSSDVCSSDLKQLSSVGFSTFLENTFNRSVRQLVFVIGGPYGFSAAVYERANEKISLSSMTFRSEERRVGKESVSTCRSRWSPYH